MPGHEAALSQLADAATAANGETAISEDTGAAFTADDTEFNIFNTDRKLAAVEALCEVLESDSRQKIDHSIHGRHHANRRGKPLGTDRRHQRRESLQRFHLQRGFARLADGHAGRRRQRRRVRRQRDVYRRHRRFPEPVAAGFARHTGDAGGRHRRANAFSTSEISARFFRACRTILPVTTWWDTTAPTRRMTARGGACT